jgi:Penicillin amidase
MVSYETVMPRCARTSSTSSEAQGEAVVAPDRVADNRGREPVAWIADGIGRASDYSARGRLKLTMPLGVVLRAMRMKFGDESGWSWDRLHALRFRHPLGAGGRILDWFFSRGTLPMVGDSTTVRKATTVARAPFVVTELSSYRQIRDVGQRDRTLAINTTGQSGNPMSTHYFDQAPLWQTGEYRLFPFSRRHWSRPGFHD